MNDLENIDECLKRSYTIRKGVACRNSRSAK